MRNAVVALLLLFQLPTSQACRGPFSAAYQIHLRPDHQVYIGRVIAVTHGPVLNAGTPYERRDELTTLKVTRRWHKTSLVNITVRGVGMSVGDNERCVRRIYPKADEQWLVVTHKTLDGDLQAEQLMSIKMGDQEGDAAVAIVGKTLGAGHSP